MATIIFSTIGSAAGAFVGGPVGAALGQSLGALAGNQIDGALHAPSERAPQTAAPGDIHIQTSTEGAPILEAFGTIRTAGQIIWATPFQKHEGSSGQGKGGGQAASESYYTVSLAIGLGQGKIDALQHIWADGQKFARSRGTWRFYQGTQDQQPDPLIERIEGFAPAYRGLAYVVFENLDLSLFGNRLPQFSFGITRNAVKTMDRVRAITIIPGATEFGYHPVEHLRSTGLSTHLTENKNNDLGKTDWTASLDQLEEVCPNCESVSLVVAWFATSIYMGRCKIRPKVIIKERQNVPNQWSIGPLSRGDSQVSRVTYVEGRPAFGGTPADLSVVAAIRDLKRRGYRVMFHPFIMVDVPPNYLWRGEIRPRNENESPFVIGEATNFFGQTQVHEFDIRDNFVNYFGSRSLWGMRRFILHYAYLCKLAGGVDAFLVGSELGGITRSYSVRGFYPVVEKLIELAADVKQVLPTTKISYGANWDEYRGHDLGDGRFYFHLDPLWAHEAIDFVGIDYYMPLADWRDRAPNIDESQGRAASIYDLNYLRGNIAAGEGYEWYYKNKTERDQQIRTPITDGLNKPWVYRWKDISSWWKNFHYNRSNGQEETDPTAWRPGMKPIWFTETGCAAADKSANQPNVFIDRSSLSSSSAGLPYYSSGARDDFMQNRYLEAVLTAFDPGHPAHLDDFNAKIDNTRMIDPDHMFIWCWDARPYPYFPEQLDVWSDGVNWAQGHWITGRATFSSVPDTVAQIMAGRNFADYDDSDLRFSLKGFRIDRISSARDVLEALMRFFFFDAVERNGKIHFIHRDKKPVAEITADECVITEEGEPGYQLTRAQETELPQAVKLVYILHSSNYQQAVAEARRLTGTSSYVAEARLPIIANQAEALAAAQSWLHETLIARERAELRLPPSRLALEPGDVITFICNDRRRRNMRITSIRDEGARIIEAVAVEPSIYRGRFAPAENNVPAASAAQRATATQKLITARATALPDRPSPVHPAIAAQPVYGPPLVEMMDLPHLRGDEILAPHVAIHAQPRPDLFAVYRSTNGQYGWQRKATISAQPTIGVIETPLAVGPEECWDEVNNFRVQMLDNELSSRSTEDVLAGANYAAIKHQTGWEIIQFRNAELARGDNPNATYYQISGLLRGLAGTEQEMKQPISLNAPFVLLESNNVVQLDFTPVERNVSYHWRVGAASQPYSSIAYRAFEYRYTGINLRPLSPVHLRAEHLDNGDIALNWIRRTRSVVNDGWGQQDVTLGEEYEAYQIDILKQGKVIRQLDAAAPRVLYTAAQQEQDFEAQLNQISVRIYQLSAVFGRGSPREETINV